MTEEATVNPTTPATETVQVTETVAPVTEATPAAEPAVEAAAENPSWYEKFPSKYRNNGEPDVEKLINGYEHLQTKLSSKGFAPPADIAEYEYTPKNFSTSDEDFNNFKSTAQELGVNKEQFSKLLEMHDQEMAKVYVPQEVAEAQMKEYWGKDYAKNSALAQKAFEEFSDDTITDEDVRLLRHPTFLKYLAAVGAQLGEDSNPLPAAAGKAGTSYEDIQAIMASPDYYNNQTKRAQVDAWYAKNR